MLRIYPVCLQMVKAVRPYEDRIALFDRNLASQLKDASSSVPLNVAEGSGARAGRRRNAYDIALGEARETLCILQVAESKAYIDGIEPRLLRMLDQIIGTLVNVLY